MIDFSTGQLITQLPEITNIKFISLPSITHFKRFGGKSPILSYGPRDVILMPSSKLISPLFSHMWNFVLSGVFLLLSCSEPSLRFVVLSVVQVPTSTCSPATLFCIVFIFKCVPFISFLRFLLIFRLQTVRVIPFRPGV
jgi:hypothetical protein